MLELVDNGNHDVHRKHIRVPNYVPNIAKFCVMSIAIMAMVVFIIKRRHLTGRVHENRSTSRHNLHSKFSLWSITAFFVGVCMLGINYLLVEISCKDNWMRCHRNEAEFLLVNLFEVIFQIVFMAFAGCETIVCWTMKHLNFKSSQWVWHGLAVVQAANIAIWFDSVFKESDHRNKENVDSFYSYFTFCNMTWNNVSNTGNTPNLEADAWCSESSIVPHWFVISSPFLFPITIEFSLLVSETFLDKTIGAESHSVDDNVEDTTRNDDDVFYDVEYEHSSTEIPDERTPLLPNRDDNVRTEIIQDSTSSSG